MSFADFEDEWSAGVDFTESQPSPLTFVEVCSKCRGSGVYTRSSRFGTRCFACKGAGKFTRRTSPEARAKARASTAKARVKAAEAKAATAVSWLDANPTETAWLKASAARGFGFAESMLEALLKYGSLTERQLDAVQRMAAADADRAAAFAAEKAQREASAPALTVEKIEQAFATAKAHGVEFPKLRLAGFKFSPAPTSGANAGAIYVKATESGEYLGKIAGGRFLRVRTCEEVTAAEVVAVASNPAAAATAYGQRTGKCSCCGRGLTVKESIDRAIGPICAEKYGW